MNIESTKGRSIVDLTSKPNADSPPPNKRERERERERERIKKYMYVHQEGGLPINWNIHCMGKYISV